jgi:hypothetical protein
MTLEARVVAYTGTELGVQRLRRCGLAICQNFSDRRRKVVDAGTRHDDAVPAAVSFLGDAQESPAVVLAELHVEMLALNLQFSRLDDVIHFLPEAADSTSFDLGNGRKIRTVHANLLGPEQAPSQGQDWCVEISSLPQPRQVAALVVQSTIPCACSNFLVLLQSEIDAARQGSTGTASLSRIRRGAPAD